MPCKEAPCKLWKVGELARFSGVSVRTLHHYDAIGLLRPSQRSESGYRLYRHSDVVRLGQIKSLRHMGFSLEAVRTFLTRDNWSPQHVISLHLEQLKKQIEVQQQLRRRLEALEARLGTRQDVSAEEFMKMMEAMNMSKNYFTPEQMQEIEERGRVLGEQKIREVEAEWPRLIEQVRVAMQRGDDPASEHVQSLARRWRELLEMFTGGNPEIQQSLNTMYREETAVAGIDTADMREMGNYIARANEAAQP
ncbi:MAG TPA: MerR family transcriptional regulator [Abditibacteriaceae bacterium]|jgi:DNA-binding transcriptional MerR regulator